MRPAILIAIAAVSLLLAACGSDEKTVVVNPQPQQPSTTIVNPPQQTAPGNTVVVPQGSTTRICPSGAVTC